MQVVDATASSSGCNRVVLFLSDGEPNEWGDSDYAAVKAKAASYSPPVHVLTYALGSGANQSVLQQVQTRVHAHTQHARTLACTQT